MTIIDRIKDLVAEGETEKSIDELLTYVKTQDNELTDRIILLKSRMHDLNDAIHSGTINDTEASIQRAKINESILRILHNITPSYLESRPGKQKQRTFTQPASPTPAGKNRNLLILLGIALVSVVVYFAINESPITTAPEVHLELPVFEHNVVLNADYWMEIMVPGTITGAKGSKCQLVVRFLSNGQFIPARLDEVSYKDGLGNVASGTEPFIVPSNNYQLGEHVIRIPYRSFNLPETGGQTTHTLHLFAELYLNDLSVKVTPSQMFYVTW